MKIDVRKTLADHGTPGIYNDRPARYAILADAAVAVQAEGDAPARKAEIGDVVISWENEDGKRRGAIFPLTNIDGRLVAKLENEALGYDRKIAVGGSDIRQTIRNLGDLYGLVALTNEAKRKNPDYEQAAIDAAAPQEVIEPKADDNDAIARLLVQIRDRIGADADNFQAEKEQVKAPAPLSQKDLDRVMVMIHVAEVGLDLVIQDDHIDPADASAVFDHRARLNLQPQARLSAADTEAVREIRALRERIAMIDPDNPDGKIYTHVLPAEPVDEEDLAAATDATRKFVTEDLRLHPTPTAMHMQARSGSATAMDMARETFKRWTSQPMEEVMRSAIPINGDQRRSLVARLRNHEVEDDPNRDAVRAFRAAVNPEYDPKETVFKAGESVILLVDDPHGGSTVYAWPEITAARIDADKPAFVPFRADEILDEEGLKTLRDAVRNAEINDDRDIAMDDF